MFFDMDLLCLKRHGKFALIWLAANRGIRSIGKSQIEHVNIIKTCEDIFKYYRTKSVSPRQRLSLFLSAKLMYGAVLVYRQQVLNLEQTIITFICLIRRPISLIPDDVDLEGTGKKRRTKRKRRALSTPEEPNLLLSRGEQQVAELRECEEQLRRSLPLQDVNLTHGSNITLRDEIRAPQGHAETDLFGDEGQIDYQLAQFNVNGLLFPGAADALEMPPPPPPPASTPLPDLDRVQESDPTTRQLSTPVSRKRPHSPEVAHSPHTRRKIAENIVDVVEPAEPAVLQPVSVDAPPPVEAQVPMVPPPTPPPTRRLHPVRRIRGNMNTSVRNLNLGDNKFLNRVDVNFEAIGRNITGRIMSPRTRDIDPARIMELLLSGVRFTAADVSAVVIGNVRENLTIESSGNELTVGHELSTRTRGASSSIIPANESVQELEPVSVVPENIEAPVLEMITDPVVPSPRLSRIQKIDEDISSIKEQGQGDVGSYSPKHDRVHTSTPVPFQTELNRQQNLINRLRTMFVELEETDQCLTIEHIVFPLNRLNVAVTFSDLLTLQAINYVTLVSKPINELNYITPGPKLLVLSH